MTCARCGHPGKDMWLRHRASCNRFFDGACDCRQWCHESCMRPRVSSRVTPLAARLRAAHNRQQVIAVEVS